MTKILTMPAMATEGTTVCYTVTHDDLIDFAREIIERTKEMDEAEKAETSASVSADMDLPRHNRRSLSSDPDRENDNATLVTPIHFTGFEKQETSNGPEYLFYGSNCINYYRDVHENVISSIYN